MRIAQVAPLFESVPPHGYGGTERVVAYLTDALVEAGHDVTLFASGDSDTRARLIATRDRSLRTDPSCDDSLAPHYVMLEEVYRRAGEFDVVHFHCDYLHYPMTRRARIAAVTTLHGRLDLPELAPLYRVFDDVPLVSISDHQRRPLDWLAWCATVHHGLPLDLHRPGEPQGYLAFVGRLSRDKRIDRAVEIAQRTGMRLVVAAKRDKIDAAYHAEIEHLLSAPGVEFIGEVGEERKGELLRGATALLFPIDWPEPFGLVMIEAMACGTPVVAWRRGAVPEVIDDGVTGWVVESIDEAVAAVGRAHTIDRAACRATFERRFSAARMAAGYLEVYRSLTAAGRRHEAA